MPGMRRSGAPGRVEPALVVSPARALAVTAVVVVLTACAFAAVGDHGTLASIQRLDDAWRRLMISGRLLPLTAIAAGAAPSVPSYMMTQAGMQSEPGRPLTARNALAPRTAHAVLARRQCGDQCRSRARAEPCPESGQHVRGERFWVFLARRGDAGMVCRRGPRVPVSRVMGRAPRQASSSG
jgi:hypothetical protein